MAGTYPKEFVFTGWHPFCICLATPILMNHDEFAEYLLNDTIPMDPVYNRDPVKSCQVYGAVQIFIYACTLSDEAEYEDIRR